MRKLLAAKLIPLSGKLEHAGFSLIAFVELTHFDAMKGITFGYLLIFGVISVCGDWFE